MRIRSRPGGDVPSRWIDRKDAGRQLAEKVMPLVVPEDSVILALPRGGVPVAYEVASRVGAPLDVLVVRKLGVPWQPELAFGAIASGDVVILNEDVVRVAQLADPEIDPVLERERLELERRERLYRQGRPPAEILGKTAVIVDDGIATGSTVRAALRAAKERGAARSLVACPVAAPQTMEMLRGEADEVVCLKQPPDFMAVGRWYEDFSPVSDDEVLTLLSEAGAE